jgi:hypothetical protein
MADETVKATGERTTGELVRQIGEAALELSNRFRAENPGSPPIAYYRANGVLHALWNLQEEVQRVRPEPAEVAAGVDEVKP